jgi:hypothetical protein
MHRGHDHEHEPSGLAPAIASLGHNQVNAPVRPAQWQVLHGSPNPAGGKTVGAVAADLDLVEAAFVEGFLAASDPTSFLRLAGAPFRAAGADGTTLALLRVEIDSIADVGAITPHLGGNTFRYDPLPASMVSRRRRLRFIYFDGTSSRPLSLAEILALSREAAPRE